MASYTAQSRETGRVPLPMDTARGLTGAWWLQPLLTVLALTAFAVYTTWRAFENRFYCWPWPASGGSAHAVDVCTYLSPFYSPYFPIHLKVATYVVSPAIYILIFPLVFRLSCYYYRKAYYRSFFWDPPACAITEPMAESRRRYTGERVFPFILQNLHRFGFYAAVVILWFLACDAVDGFFFVDHGVRHFGIGIGSIVLLVNVILLGLYTFGCHSWRHLIGGSVDCYSCTGGSQTRYGIWKKVSFLNKSHALYAWVSMFSVAFADIYVDLVARGVITDLRLF